MRNANSRSGPQDRDEKRQRTHAPPQVSAAGSEGAGRDLTEGRIVPGDTPPTRFVRRDTTITPISSAGQGESDVIPYAVREPAGGLKPRGTLSGRRQDATIVILCVGRIQTASSRNHTADASRPEEGTCQKQQGRSRSMTVSIIPHTGPVASPN